MAEIDTRFGKMLREYRTGLGMTQLELALAAQINGSHLNRIELGKRKPPKIDTVFRLAAIVCLHNPDRLVEFFELAGYSEIPKHNIEAMSQALGSENSPQARLLAYSVMALVDNPTLTPTQREIIAKTIKSFLRGMQTFSDGLE